MQTGIWGANIAGEIRVVCPEEDLAAGTDIHSSVGTQVQSLRSIRKVRQKRTRAILFYQENAAAVTGPAHGDDVVRLNGRRGVAERGYKRSIGIVAITSDESLGYTGGSCVGIVDDQPERVHVG